MMFLFLFGREVHHQFALNIVISSSFKEYDPLVVNHKNVYTSLMCSSIDYRVLVVSGFVLLQVNNDRSRDYTMPTAPPPVMNAQPSISGQQQAPMSGPPAQQYNTAQYAPSNNQNFIPQSQAGWGAAPPPPHAMQRMHHNPYMPPGTMPPQAGPGMMQYPGHYQ